MDFFDERILATLKDLKPRDFDALLHEAGFTHNTLQQHLQQLTARGLVVKEKMASNNLGRPKFTYSIPSSAAKQVTNALQAMSNGGQLELVAYQQDDSFLDSFRNGGRYPSSSLT